MSVSPAGEHGGGLVVLERGTVEGVDFRRAAFARIAPSGCLFVDCDFRGLAFDARLAALFASPAQSTFRGCRFDGADLRRAPPGQSRFEECSFAEARIDGWSSVAGEFVGCTFSGRIKKARFYGRAPANAGVALDPPRGRNEFRGNDLRATVLVDTSFVQGIALEEQRWPADGGERLDHIQQRLERARLEVMRRSAEERAPAVALLMHLGAVYGEQRSLYRAQYDGSADGAPAEVRSSVWALLARAPERP